MAYVLCMVYSSKRILTTLIKVLYYQTKRNRGLMYQLFLYYALSIYNIQKMVLSPYKYLHLTSCNFLFPSDLGVYTSWEARLPSIKMQLVDKLYNYFASVYSCKRPKGVN